MLMTLLFLAVLLLAYCNGANDNFKGVATLYGSGTVSYRTAIAIATVATFAGSICAIFIAQGLVSSFSGKGLVPVEVAGNIHFLIAVAFGAAFTVLFATRIGFPISTTHSLVGALLGAGLMSVGAEVNLGQLGKAFFIPLMFSPLIAFCSAFVLYGVFTFARKKFGITKEFCFCIGKSRQIIPQSALQNSQSIALSANQELHLANLDMSIASDKDCVLLYSDKVAGVYLQKILDFAHTTSAATVSFARGLNDTPKIMGLLITSQIFEVEISMIAIAILMAIGGLLNAKRVAETISHKITPLSHSQGFSANLVTGILVIFASNYGVPVSTTHVSVGSIFGISMLSGKRDNKMIGEILLSWLITLPVAMTCGAIIFFLLSFTYRGF